MSEGLRDEEGELKISLSSIGESSTSASFFTSFVSFRFRERPRVGMR